MDNNTCNVSPKEFETFNTRQIGKELLIFSEVLIKNLLPVSKKIHKSTINWVNFFPSSWKM